MMERIKKIYNSRLEFEQKPDKCPVCGSIFISEIEYGDTMFVHGLTEYELKEGRVAAGEFSFFDDRPEWRCDECDKTFFMCGHKRIVERPAMEALPKRIKEVICRDLWWKICDEFDLENSLPDLYRLVTDELIGCNIDFFRDTLNSDRLFLNKDNILHRGKVFTVNTANVVCLFGYIIKQYEETEKRVWS